MDIENIEIFERAWLDVGLLTENPEDQDGLILELVDDLVPTRIKNRYEKEKNTVSCAHCARTKNHGKGITVEFENGELALFGYDCAEAVFGKTVVDRFRKDLRARERDTIYRKLLEPNLEAINSALTFFDSKAGGVEMAVTKFVRELPYDVYDLINENVQQGTLVKTRSDRSTAIIVDKNGEPKTVRQAVEKDVFRVKGCSVLHWESWKLISIGNRLKKLKSILLDENVTESDVKMVGRLRQDLATEISELPNFARDLPLFFEQKNFQLFIKWISWASKEFVRAHLAENTIEFETREYLDDVVIELPKIAPLPNFSEVVDILRGVKIN